MCTSGNFHSSERSPGDTRGDGQASPSGADRLARWVFAIFTATPNRIRRETAPGITSTMRQDCANGIGMKTSTPSAGTFSSFGTLDESR